MALAKTFLADGSVSVTAPLKFKLSAVGRAIHLGVKSYIEMEQPLVLNREEKWIVSWEREENQPLVCNEKDLLANYELIREVLVSVHDADGTTWSHGIPPLGDFQGAMIYTTSLMNYHSELYRVRGGKGRIKDWGHRESNRLRASFSHLHRLAMKTEESRTPEVRVLKKVSLGCRNSNSIAKPFGAGAQPVAEDPDDDPESQVQLVVDDLDDEPILIKEIPAAAPYLPCDCEMVKEEDAPIAIEDSQAEDTNEPVADENQVSSPRDGFESYCDEYVECSKECIDDGKSSAVDGGMMATHPDQAETLDYVPPDLAAGSMPAPFGTEEEPVNLSSAAASGEASGEPGEPGLAERQAALRKTLKKKAKQDELEKNAKKEDKARAKQVAAELKESKREARKAAAEEKEKNKVARRGRGQKAPDADVPEVPEPSVPEPSVPEPSVPESSERKRRGSRKCREKSVPVSEPSVGSVPDTAGDKPSPERKWKRLRKVADVDPVPEAEDCPKQRKILENFELVQSAGIPELVTDLKSRKSYTVRPPDGSGVVDGARAIGVVLITQSFYVNKSMLALDAWPQSLRSLYKVDVKDGITIPWFRNGVGKKDLSKVTMVQTAWEHSQTLAGWLG